MAKRKPEVGGVYRIKSPLKIGGDVVEVVGVDSPKGVEVALGTLRADGNFTRKTYKGKRGEPVRRAFISSDNFSEQLFMLNNSKGVDKMAEKVIPVDDQGNEIPEGAEAPKKKTKLEIAAERLEAEKEREENRKKKDEAKKTKIATDRADKLKEAMKGVTAAKESELALAASDGAVKTFVELDNPQAKKANDAIKELKKAQDKAEKNAEKLIKAAQDAGLTEKQVAGDYSNQRTLKFMELTDEETATALDALKESAKQKRKDDALALKTTLSDEEAAELAKQERTLDKLLPNFLSSVAQIGGALTVINQKRLYRQTHKTFEQYVAERYDLSRPHAYSVMAAAATFDALIEGGLVDSKSLPSITAAEAITRGVKGLLKEGNFGDEPELENTTRQLARNVYDLARQTAPKNADGSANITPAHISSTFAVLNEIAKTGTVDVDGKAVPINLAAASIDEMITTQSAERVARMKASLSDRMAALTAQAQEARAAASNGNINTAVGNNVPIPKGATPKLSASCSIHGRVEIKDTTDTDITLACECVFIHSAEGFVFEKNAKYPDAVAAGNA